MLLSLQCVFHSFKRKAMVGGRGNCFFPGEQQSLSRERHESRDTGTEEKCLSNELGNQKAGGRGEETTKCRNQKATQRAYCSLVLRGLKPQMNLGRFFKDSKVLCSFLIALSDLC